MSANGRMTESFAYKSKTGSIWQDFRVFPHRVNTQLLFICFCPTDSPIWFLNERDLSWMINNYGFLGNTYQSNADSSLYRLKPDHFAMNPINVGVGDFLKRVWVGVYGAFIDAFWFCDKECWKCFSKSVEFDSRTNCGHHNTKFFTVLALNAQLIFEIGSIITVESESFIC